MTTSPKILLVEDDPQSAKLALITMERAGLQAVHVDNGAKAVAYLDGEKPDVIVLDLSLPQIDGWQVLDLAQAKYGAETIKVIVTSAQGDAVNKLIGRLHLVVRYLVKPYLPDQLTAALKEILSANS